MAIARAETVDPREGGTYHCWSRCVRRAFLCGMDALTGKNYDHRKQWVEDRLEKLVGIFAIDCLAYAIMDNHQHMIIRNEPLRAEEWSATEIAMRWRTLFPKRRNKDVVSKEVAEAEILEITENPERVEELRVRLSDISWFMRCLNENIARRANAEDEVTGRFWEGRFRCTRLDDDRAVLAGMVYVDLNPIRAGKAKTPEESEYTSAFLRISTETCLGSKGKKERKAEAIKPSKREPIKPYQPKRDNWLCPIESVFSRNSNLTLNEYLLVLDHTGRELAKGKGGSIPQELAPILVRLKIKRESWLSLTTNFRTLFPRVSGSPEKMRRAAERAGRHWFKGLSAARACF